MAIVPLFEEQNTPSPPPHAYYPGHPSFPLSSAHPYSSSAYASYRSESPHNLRRASSASSSPPASFLSSEWIDHPISAEDRVERAPSVSRLDREPVDLPVFAEKSGGKGKKIGKEQHVVAVEEVADIDDEYEVDLLPEEHPQHLPLWRKWLAVVIVSCCSFCVTGSSSMAAFTETAVANDFHISHEIAVLSVSLFVEGMALGPLLTGPLSEMYGRNITYRASFTLMFAFSFGVAFAPNTAVYLIFRFLSGFVGSTFLSVAGGTVSDLFTNEEVANPMAFYTCSPFIGPIFGPLVSGFINQNLYWRWTYYILTIWIFVQTVFLYICVPETYAPILRKWKAARIRKSTGDANYWAPLDKQDKNIAEAMLISFYKPFELIFYERMALLLNLWTSMVLGILYLTFQAFPIIFTEKHSFSIQQSGLTFLGIGVGMVCAMPTQSYFNKLVVRDAKNNGGMAPPESRLYMGEIGAVLVPISLFWLSFTTYASVPWIVPIIASIPFGIGLYYVFTAVFTYLVTAYRPLAASAMAGNTAMRCTFAAVFSLFAGYMYNGMGTVGATALLAGIMSVMAPLPFIFRRIGPRLREKSRFAAH
ncbi:MFS general substrate transporter [Lentinula raphanica]|uniref:MFS general substrate transporter n=1 Tax=Lentinula raphanica TaxID=153919 RepID=A0AA38P7E0_9AGAR|nr:MFS general substrate transporter [Lentinula raphanica]KAJ3970160.1 MFS general substrate transporter [Lentinula raphanica]